MKKHVMQSELWEKFKREYGTPTVRAGGVLYTKHQIPFTSHYYGYSAKVNPFDINFEELKRSLKENSCVALQLDVPNVVRGSPEEPGALEILKVTCEESPRSEFAEGNLLLDLAKSEEDLLRDMHYKQRYNLNYSVKKGVSIRRFSKETDFDIFYDLYKETGDRQKFYFRPRAYLKGVWDVFRAAGVAEILIAEYEGQPLSSWMLLNYDGVLYYPYGGSTERLKNLQANSLIGWEAIKYGKENNCETFDMWGAAKNMEDTNDPYYGFSQFKARFGAKHVIYINSYVYVLNETVYRIFFAANNLRWKVLNVLR